MDADKEEHTNGTENKNPIVGDAGLEEARDNDSCASRTSTSTQQRPKSQALTISTNDPKELMRRLTDPGFDMVMHLNEMETLALTRPSEDAHRTLAHLFQSNATNIVLGLVAIGFVIGLFAWCLSNDVTGLTDLQALLVLLTAGLFGFEVFRFRPIQELRKMPTPLCSQRAKDALVTRELVFSRLRELLVMVGGKSDSVPPPLKLGDTVSDYKKWPYVLSYAFGAIIISHIIAMVEYGSGHD